MLVVGLTGGIGAGKTTFSALLAERGAQIIDVDGLGRDAVRPGLPAWKAIVEQFGEEVLAAGTMEIDRKRLAAIVFGDRQKLAALNAIVHPEIFRRIAEHLERLRLTDEIVVLDAALLTETGLDRAANVVIVVESPTGARSRRVELERGMPAVEFRARMGAQAAPEKLRERADIVVDNSGSLDDLAAAADRVWKELVERRDKRGPEG